MDKSELRSLVFAVLRSQPQTQFDGVKSRLRNLAVDYSPDDDILVHEILWECLTQGILAPGMSTSSLDFPYIHVTDYGQKCIESGEFQPHDPDGYLERLQESIGQALDPVMAAYLGESLRAYLSSHFLAASALLGIAAERCLDLLTQQLMQTIPEKDQKEIFEYKINHSGRSLKQRLGTLRNELQSRTLPPEFMEDLDLQLTGLYTLLLHSRNEAGHPTLQTLDRDTVYGNLLVFPRYCQGVYQLLGHLEAAGSPSDGPESG